MNETNQSSSTELRAMITKQLQELAEATDAARVSEVLLNYLNFCVRFHHYSWCNQLLILAAMPDAKFVAGYKKWQTFNRYVCKGQVGIPILAPLLATRINEQGKSEEVLVGFKVVYVFDVSQTAGEDLPKEPEWKSPQKNAELKRKLIQFAHDKGVKVLEKHIGHEIQGVSLGGKIIIDPEAGTKTLIHEIAHELIHHNKSTITSSIERELEAEGTAYVVGKHFGLDGLSSPNYVALHGATAEMIMEHLEHIQIASKEIIQTLENNQ
jgi:hypothetical protein